MARVQRRFLRGSHWTALVPLAGGECHFEVIAVTGDEVTLRAVLTRVCYVLPATALDDVAAWALGWQSLP